MSGRIGKYSIGSRVMSKSVGSSLKHSLLTSFYAQIGHVNAVPIRLYRSVHAEDQTRKHEKSKKVNWRSDEQIRTMFMEIFKKSLHGLTIDAISEFNEFKNNNSGLLHDWMTLRMASAVTITLGIDEGLNILKNSQNDRMGNYPRKATVNDQQVCVDLNRILSSSSDPQIYDFAKQFYIASYRVGLVKPKRDTLNLLIGYWLQRNEFGKAIEELEDLLKTIKVDSNGKTLFMLISALYKNCKDKDLIQNGENLVAKYAQSSLQRICIIGCGFLQQGQFVRLVELLDTAGCALNFDHVQFICDIAASYQIPNALHILLDSHEIFKLGNKSLDHICGTLVMIYGKMKNVDELNKIWESVHKDIKIVDEFRITKQRLKHFYKCLRVSTPEMKVVEMCVTARGMSKR